MIMKMDTFEFNFFLDHEDLVSGESLVSFHLTILNNNNKNQRTNGPINAQLRSGICDLS